MRKAALFAFLLLALYGCKSVSIIANNLTEREANEVVVLLVSRGISAQKVAVVSTGAAGASSTQLWNISVPAREITDALAVLNQAGLPRTKGTSLLDLFGAQGLVPSDLQNKIRYQEGLSEQLAMTIRKMDGIIDADVQITFPDTESEMEMTASVYIKHRGILDNPNSLLITKIKRLVSSALPGLKADNVAVITDRALLSDITLESLQKEEGKELVSVLGVVVMKDSLGLMRTILFICIFLAFFFLSLTAWMIWKCFPLLSKNGFKTFLSLKPFQVGPLSDAEVKTEEVQAMAKVEEGVFEAEDAARKGGKGGEEEGGGGGE